jgi:hypothetical protein
VNVRFAPEAAVPRKLQFDFKPTHQIDGRFSG